MRGAPRRLWVQGALPQGPTIAIVGARAARAETLKLAHQLSQDLATQGWVIVSGGALGIDGAAHRGALAGQGKTIVVLGSGVDVAYPPDNKPLFTQITEHGGAVISQFPPGTEPTKWSFPKRNLTIAAMAKICVVVEAGIRSGALSTARWAQKLGRELVVYLGSPGCDALAARGVKAGRTLEDVQALIAGQGLKPVEPVNPGERQLYQALDHQPRDLAELARRAGLAIMDAMALAIELEVQGLAARVPGGRYLRLT